VYWLRYLRDGETRVVILDGWSVAHARMRAAGLDPGVYVSGCRIDHATAAHSRRERASVEPFGGRLPEGAGGVFSRSFAALRSSDPRNP
jgi:hypothetical protein